MSDETRNEQGDGDAGDGRQSPGGLLKAARERMGLSLDELAARTLLYRNTLAALEANDFEKLSQPVFVRGYYRKCAKVLDISEGDLMTAYAEHSGVSGPRPASPGQVDVIPQDVTPRSWRVLNALLVVLAVAAVLAAAWWLIPRLDQGAPGDEGIERSPLTPLDEGGGAPSNAAAPAGEAPPAGEASPAGEAPPAGETPPDAAAEGEPARLRLRVAERSWVEVSDAGGERLLGDVLPAGTERTFAGRPPYEVVLGNAPGVAIFLGGERVRFEDRIRDNNTARLTVAAEDGE